MSMILTVFGCILAACLAVWVAGAIVVYWKKVLIGLGVLCCLLTGYWVWRFHQYDVQQKEHPYNVSEEVLDTERRFLVEDISLAIHHWRDNGEQIPYKKGPRDPGDFEIVDGINDMTQTRSDLKSFCKALKKVNLDTLRTLKAVLPSTQWEADYSVRAPVPASTPSSSTPEPKIHRTQPETWLVEK